MAISELVAQTHVSTQKARWNAIAMAAAETRGIVQQLVKNK